MIQGAGLQAHLIEYHAGSGSVLTVPVVLPDGRVANVHARQTPEQILRLAVQVLAAAQIEIHRAFATLPPAPPEPDVGDPAR